MFVNKQSDISSFIYLNSEWEEKFGKNQSVSIEKKYCHYLDEDDKLKNVISEIKKDARKGFKKNGCYRLDIICIDNKSIMDLLGYKRYIIRNNWDGSIVFDNKSQDKIDSFMFDTNESTYQLDDLEYVIKKMTDCVKEDIKILIGWNIVN